MTAARVATDALTIALLGLADQGLRTHCSDPASHHLWLSERDAERAVAVLLCDHCPIITICRDTAEQRDERCCLCRLTPISSILTKMCLAVAGHRAVVQIRAAAAAAHGNPIRADYS
jgi:hypothetical protein